MTQNAMDFPAYHCVFHTGICAYNMLQVYEAEKKHIIHVVPCRGKGVSFWFDSSQDGYASGLASSSSMISKWNTKQSTVETDILQLD